MRLLAVCLAGGCAQIVGIRESAPPDGARPPDAASDAFPGDLVPYYPLDSLSSITDATGNGHDGTCTETPCPTLGIGVLSDSYAFNGGERFNVAAAPQLQTSEGTVAAWVEFDVVPSAATVCPLNAYLSGGNGANTWQVCYTGADWAVYLSSGGYQMPASITIGVWYHIALTWTATSSDLYVDGSDFATGTLTAPLTFDPTGPFTFGADRNDDGSIDAPMTGKLDELKMFDRALGSAEIAALAAL